MLLEHRLRAEGNVGEIKVIKEYGHLPKVTCYVSQLNQVFMNLLNNAIDALQTQSSPRILTIRTETRHKTPEDLLPQATSCFPKASHLLPDSVVIRITDNGPGMSEAIQKNIFDPFFTTKPVGTGTGLGLSISYQIVVEIHKGQLSCVSVPGQGTELIVEIPVISSLP